MPIINNQSISQFHNIANILISLITLRLVQFSWEYVVAFSIHLEFYWFSNQKVTSCEFCVIFITSYVYLTSLNLRITTYSLIVPVTSYFLHTSFMLLFIAKVPSYRYCISCELRLAYKEWITAYCTSCELFFYMRVTSYN